MRVNEKNQALTVIVLMVAGIGLSMIFNLWVTESSKTPAKITEGVFAGQADPADIRGSYTFSDLEEAFGVPVSDIAEAYKIPMEEAAAYQPKRFEEVFVLTDGREIGTDSMRLFIALYLGIPYEAEDTTALPAPALSLLKKKELISEDQWNELQSRKVFIEDILAEGVEVSHNEEATEMEIKGKTTFIELYDWGLSKEQVESGLGMAAGASGVSVRDFCKSNEIEFSTVKATLQQMLDKQDS